MRVRISIKILTKDCSVFAGKVTIASTEFFFRLQSNYPIETHQMNLLGKTVKDFREVILIEIQKDNEKIELLDDEYKIFYYLFIEYAIDLFNAIQKIKQERGRISDATAIYDSGHTELSHEICKIVSRPKFGCNLLEDEQGSELNGIN